MMRLYINFNPHIKYPHQRGPRSFGDTSYLSIRRFIDPINTYSSAPMLIYNHTTATCCKYVCIYVYVCKYAFLPKGTYGNIKAVSLYRLILQRDVSLELCISTV